MRATSTRKSWIESKTRRLSGGPGRLQCSLLRLLRAFWLSPSMSSKSAFFLRYLQCYHPRDSAAHLARRDNLQTCMSRNWPEHLPSECDLVSLGGQIAHVKSVGVVDEPVCQRNLEFPQKGSHVCARAEKTRRVWLCRTAKRSAVAQQYSSQAPRC